MKIIKTNGIYFLNQVGACSDWYWGEDFASGDLYEAEDAYKRQKPIKTNRLVLVHLPEGQVIEPIIPEEGQYIGIPSLYYEGKVYVVMVDFKERQIHLLAFDPDEILKGGRVETLEILPLSCVRDCYNLFISGTAPILTRESSDNSFQILWSLEDGPINVEFQVEERESFSHRDGDKLYFTSWWEKEEPEYEYHDEIIIRNLHGDILDRFEGGIQEIRPGEYYVLQ